MARFLLLQYSHLWRVYQVFIAYLCQFFLKSTQKMAFFYHCIENETHLFVILLAGCAIIDRAFINKAAKKA